MYIHIARTYSYNKLGECMALWGEPNELSIYTTSGLYL